MFVYIYRNLVTFEENSKLIILPYLYLVLLECGPQMMNVKMFFNRTIFRQFSDWIVVGLNNRIECRQQGNGDLQYVIEIPLTTEPCGTKMVKSLRKSLHLHSEPEHYHLGRIGNVRKYHQH